MNAGRKLLQKDIDNSTFSGHKAVSASKVGIFASAVFVCCVFLCPCFYRKRQNATAAMSKDPNSSELMFSYEIIIFLLVFLHLQWLKKFHAAHVSIQVMITTFCTFNNLDYIHSFYSFCFLLCFLCSYFPIHCHTENKK